MPAPERLGKLIAHTADEPHPEPGRQLLPLWRRSGLGRCEALGLRATPPPLRPPRPVQTVPASARRIKITEVEVMHVQPKWIFLRIHTDIGLSGIGEATCGGRGQTVATTVHEMARYLVGKDPMQIERHWQLLFRGNFRRQGPVVCSALGGIEMALCASPLLSLLSLLSFPLLFPEGNKAHGGRSQVGHQGEGARVPGVAAARRQGARQDQALRPRRRSRVGPTVLRRGRLRSERGRAHPLPRGLDADSLRRRHLRRQAHLRVAVRRAQDRSASYPRPATHCPLGLRASVAGLAGITNGAFISEPPRFIDNAIKTFSTLREVAGPDIELAVDFHGRAHQRNRPAHHGLACCSCC